MAVGGLLCFVYAAFEDESVFFGVYRNRCQHIIVNVCTNSVWNSFCMLNV